MALITCPDCGKGFSDQAAACPNCGRPNTSPARAPAPAKEEAKKKLGCVSSGAVVLVVVLIIGAIAGQSGGGASSSPGANTTGDAYQDGVKISEAEGKVKALLRDPESANFQHEIAVRHQHGIAVCGQVNAKNGFGGFTGFTDFIVIETAVLRTAENSARFGRIWNKTCR